MNTSLKTRNMVMAAVMAAIIIIMANVPFLGYIPLGVTRATIIHVPVIIGAVVLGPKYGAFLGGMFGLTSLIANTFSPTITSFVFSPFYSINGVGGDWRSLIICFGPRILIGIVAFYVYRGMKKLLHGKQKSDILSLTIAGLAGSMTNTILVMGLIYTLFGESYAAAKEITYNALIGVIMGVVTMNGIPEAIVAAVLTAAIGKVLLHVTNQ